MTFWPRASRFPPFCMQVDGARRPSYPTWPSTNWKGEWPPSKPSRNLTLMAIQRPDRRPTERHPGQNRLYEAIYQFDGLWAVTCAEKSSHHKRGQWISHSPLLQNS